MPNWKRQIERTHLAQVPLRKSLSILSRQPLGQVLKEVLPVLRALPRRLHDLAPDLPVRLDHGTIDGALYLSARGLQRLTNGHVNLLVVLLVKLLYGLLGHS